MHSLWLSKSNNFSIRIVFAIRYTTYYKNHSNRKTLYIDKFQTIFEHIFKIARLISIFLCTLVSMTIGFYILLVFCSCPLRRRGSCVGQNLADHVSTYMYIYNVTRICTQSNTQNKAQYPPLCSNFLIYHKYIVVIGIQTLSQQLIKL